jgi:hypothetical protein
VTRVTTESARYLRVVRRLALLAVLTFGLAACGGSGPSKDNLKITVGRSGGTMVPYSVTIAPDGAVTATGANPPSGRLTSAQDAAISARVRSDLPGLKSESCPGTFPDESATFITALGKTVTVRGPCEPGFTKLWNAVARALGVTLS